MEQAEREWPAIHVRIQLTVLCRDALAMNATSSTHTDAHIQYILACVCDPCPYQSRHFVKAVLLQF